MQIKNEFLTVTFKTLGAEITSIKDNNGIEYLWQGEKSSWNGKSPHLFPIVGKINDGIFTHNNKTYALPRHGFARINDFEVLKHTDHQIHFALSVNHEISKVFPFVFLFEVIYSLYENTIVIDYIVSHDEKSFTFGLGAHPGFNIPILSKENFNDYFLLFEKSSATLHLLNSDGFITGDTKGLLFIENKLPLTHHLFDNDALVFSNMGESITLTNGANGISLHFAGFPYLGVWQTPNSNAKFICLEPWASLPATKNVSGDLTTNKTNITLKNNEIFEVSYTITIK